MNRDGENSVLESLFDKWTPLLFREATRAGALDADDAIQDTRFALWRALGRGITVENPLGWALRVVRRKVWLQRDQRRYGQLEDVDNVVPSPAVQATPRVIAWGELSSRQEEVLLLRLLGWKYAEIGTGLGIGIPAANTHYHRAVRKLRGTAGVGCPGKPTSDHHFVALSSVRRGDPDVVGRITRGLAHSEMRILHAAVNLLLVFDGTTDVLIYLRGSHRTIDAGLWDVPGGHLRWDLDLTTAGSLNEAWQAAALREAREEIRVTLDGHPHVIPRRDVVPFSQLGGLAAESPFNLERSTGYVVFVPNSAQVRIVDDGTPTRPLTRRCKLDELMDLKDVADGLGRIRMYLRGPGYRYLKKLRDARK